LNKIKTLFKTGEFKFEIDLGYFQRLAVIFSADFIHTSENHVKEKIK